MSLGAIDFGLIVDGAVVLVENVVRRLVRARRPGQDGTPAHSRGRPRGRPADRVRHRHHRPGLPSNPEPRRHRGEDVQADGVDGRLRPRRLPAADADPHPGPRVASPEEDRARARASLRREVAGSVPPRPRCLPRPAGPRHPRRDPRRRGWRRRRLEARRRVPPAARRGRPFDQCRPPRLGRHLRSRGEHGADRAGPEEVSGGDHRREPVGKPRAGHRRHGDRARGRVRDPEAEGRVDVGPDEGRARREDGAGPRRDRPRRRLLVPPAHRDALQRADRGREVRRGRQAVRRRPRDASGEGRGDRAAWWPPCPARPT